MTKPSIDLRHAGCGGYYISHMTRGQFLRVYSCEKCGHEQTVPQADADVVAREERAQATRQAEAARRPVWVPDPPLRKATLQEALVIGAYREWSEEHYAAGFMDPDSPTVRSFREAMDRRMVEADYEATMLDLYADSSS